MTLVEGKDICVHLDGRLVLDRVNISVNKGEIVTLIGPNGSGKSTLIRCIIGSVLASSGSLRRQSGIKIGYVPQKLMIDGTFPITVERFLNLPKASSGANIDKALSDTGVLSLKNRNVTTLSGGQFQRVMLARALLNNPDLLIFQGGVDPLSADRLGRMNISRHGLKERNRLVFDYVDRYDLPCLVLMGGGYAKPIEPTVECLADLFLEAAARHKLRCNPLGDTV